jgi:hypothetical protein
MSVMESEHPHARRGITAFYTWQMAFIIETVLLRSCKRLIVLGFAP